MESYSMILAKVANAIRRCESLMDYNFYFGSSSVDFYPISGFLSKTDLSCLICIAKEFELDYFVSYNHIYGIHFHFYIPKKFI